MSNKPLDRDNMYFNLNDPTADIIQGVINAQKDIKDLKELGLGNIDFSSYAKQQDVDKKADKSTVGNPTSMLSSFTFASIEDWLNELERRLAANTVDPMSKKYMASGSLSVYAGSIVNNSKTLTITTSSHDFKVGHGIAIRTSDGAKEVETLKVTSGATTSGDITLKLDGVTLTITVAAGDTAIQVADKIRNVANNGNGGTVTQTLAGSGWSVDSNATGSTDTLTFSHANQGTKTKATFSGGSTGVAATVTVTTTGANITEFISKIVAINGTQFTLRDTYTGSNLASKRLEHDDDEAINDAINDASTNYGTGAIGGVVSLPAYRFPIRQIKVKPRVMFKGTGYGSRLWQRGNTNKDALVLNTTSDEMCIVSDISIDGQKNSQSSGRGLKVDNTGGSGFSFYDPLHVINNVLIMNTKGDGFVMGGTREARVTNVFVFQADGHGFQLTSTDCFFTNCTSAGAGMNGFNLNAPNTRFTACKAYGSGRIEASTSGDGFLIGGTRQLLTNCEAQDNGRHGFDLYGSTANRVVNCLADSNGNRFTGNSAGFSFGGGSTYNVVEGTALNRTNYQYQKYALSINSDCINNKVDLVSPSGTDVANKNGDIYPGQGAGNTIVINNLLGNQNVTYAASITPAVYDGGTMFITLTGNVTIANTVNGRYHPGAVMRLVLTQDATGGRTISFGSQYKTNWTPDTTAGKVNVIEFIHNGTNWVQIAATVGI